MNTKLLALCVVILAGCEEPTGVSDTLRLQWFPGLPRHSDKNVAAVEDMTGFEILAREQGPIGVYAVLQESPADHAGGAWRQNKCTRGFWAKDHAKTLAHEIGHSLGLEHVYDDQDNVMFEGYTGPGQVIFTEDQIETMREHLWVLEHRC